MNPRQRAVVGLGGALMCVGSLLPFGFSDGGEFGLHDRGAVFGFRYGGPVLGRLSDSFGANGWTGDAWLTFALGVVVLVTVFTLLPGRTRLLVVSIVAAALAGTALALYEWGYWISEAGSDPIWTEYHNSVGPGPLVTAIGGLIAVIGAVFVLKQPAHSTGAVPAT